MAAERKILFFKLRAKDDDIESQTRSFEETCTEIMKLASDSRNYTIPQAGPEEYIRLMSFGKQGGCYQGYFARYRSGNIVTGRDGSDIAEDYTLEDGRKPLEITHFIYIPEHYILAVEYNHHGPKYTHFINYVNVLQNKARLDLIYYIADTIYHPDALEIIRDAKEVKMFELTTARAHIPTGRGLTWVKSAFATLASIGKSGKLVVALRADRGQSIMSGAELATLLTDDDGNQAELDAARARVVMEDGLAPQIVNLLQNKIDSKIQIPNGEIVSSSETIFDSIWKVYSDNSKILLKASHEKYDD